MASNSLDLGGDDAHEDGEEVQRPRQLPVDLPRTLDDRQPVQINTGLEVYDDWAGKASFVSSLIQSSSC